MARAVKRNYKKEYGKFQSSKKSKKDRVARNRARRKAMKGGMITPGEESHKNNPMHVTSDGTIYAGGGPLKFKVGDGAGIYDHATDQFKEDMSDKQISKVAMKNIKKWKKNNMYS